MERSQTKPTTILGLDSVEAGIVSSGLIVDILNPLLQKSQDVSVYDFRIHIR